MNRMLTGVNRPPGAEPSGFSLIELLVSMAVLTILFVMLSQVTSLVTTTWEAGRSQADNFVQARVALDVMGRDLESAVLRSELPAFFVDGTARLAFYTRQQGLMPSADGKSSLSGNRPLSVVCYSVTNTTGGSCLRRSSHGYNFGDDLGYSPAQWSVPASGGMIDSDIGPGVLVVRWQLIATNGLNLLPDSLNAAWENQKTKDETKYGVGSLRAVILSLAVVDRDSMRLLRETGMLDQLKGNFSAADPGQLRSYAAAWQEQLDDPASPLISGGVPKRFLGSIKVLERTVLLPVSKE